VTWEIRRVVGTPAEIHAHGLPSPVRRLVRRCEATSAAVVLGSTQPEPPPSPGDALPVVRRRSGGGAVLVEPGDVLWVDVVVPRGDALWDDDVGRAFHWLGDVWVAAIGGDDVAAHRGALVTTRWSRAVCFAGLGPGEVTVDGRKVVGISQRRTREGALFQCAALLAWHPTTLAERLGLPDDALADLQHAAAPDCAGGAEGDALFDRFVQHLPE
jgi:lipoate-protein ligase A